LARNASEISVGQRYREVGTSFLGADSDEAAQAFRFDGARHSEMMPPRRGTLLAGNL
jgi:hypothetical protein